MTCIWLGSPGPESMQALWTTWKPVLVQTREGGEEMTQWGNTRAVICLVKALLTASLSQSALPASLGDAPHSLWHVTLIHCLRADASISSWREQNVMVLVTALTSLPPAFLEGLKKVFQLLVLPHKFCLVEIHYPFPLVSGLNLCDIYDQHLGVFHIYFDKLAAEITIFCCRIAFTSLIMKAQTRISK